MNRETKYINSFTKFNIVESINSLSIVEYRPSYSVKNYKGYRLLSNNVEVAYMLGLKNDDDFLIDGIKVENEFRGRNLGEILIIEYLKKYGGQVVSNSEGKRSLHAEKMWERISKRDDVNIRVEKAKYPFTPFYLKHYYVSLK